VLIGGQPSARVSDTCTCVGPPDVIVKGSMTVLVGRMMAARIGDLTAHGGTLVVGLPTVMIGDVGMGGPGAITTVQRGKFTIIVNRLDKTITILGNQEYFGDGATQAVVDKATKSINDTWSGTTTFEGETYTVNSQVTGSLRNESDPADPNSNQMQVKHTTDPPEVHKNNDPANQPYYGNGPGMIHDNEDDGGTLTIPHEMGHAMGLKDEYSEGPPDADGNRTVTRTGPDGGLMGYIDPGSKPTDQNYNDLITGNNLQPQ
jgi:hypothetical protein